MKTLIVAIAMLASTAAFAANGTYVVKHGNEYITCNPNQAPMDAICNVTLEPVGDLVLTGPAAVARGFEACAKYGSEAAKNVPVPVFDVLAGGVTCVGTGFLATLEGLLGGIFGTIEDIFKN